MKCKKCDSTNGYSPLTAWQRAAKRMKGQTVTVWVCNDCGYEETDPPSRYKFDNVEKDERKEQ